MTTQNDKAWARYIEAVGIKFDEPYYTVSATELKGLTGREPRLLAKFDTPKQLPEPFRVAGYTLIPTTNGEYQIVRGNLFIELPTCDISRFFQPLLPFPLETAGRGSGESQYIDLAFNSGLLSEFSKVSQMYLTIRGREHTKSFEFHLAGLPITVRSVQIEVDAGYEALHDIVLIEAKIGLPTHFNVRQMYYPYRHFSSLVPTKRVQNIFLAYDIPSESYHLYKYTFANLSDPLSVRLEHCASYRIAQSIRLSVYDLIDARFQTFNNLVPQADDLNKVFELLNLVDAGLNRADEVADFFVFNRRQSSYYREAAEYLGLVTSSTGNEYRLTDIGVSVLSEPPGTQSRIFAKAIVNSWVFVELIRRAGANGLFTNGDIAEIILTARNQHGSQRYSGATIGRRRQTVIAWIKWLAQEFGCFSISPVGYKLQ
jgi:hypothetical protein